MVLVFLSSTLKSKNLLQYVGDVLTEKHKVVSNIKV